MKWFIEIFCFILNYLFRFVRSSVPISNYSLDIVGYMDMDDGRRTQKIKRDSWFLLLFFFRLLLLLLSDMFVSSRIDVYSRTRTTYKIKEHPSRHLKWREIPMHWFLDFHLPSFFYFLKNKNKIIFVINILTCFNVFEHE